MTLDRLDPEDAPARAAVFVAACAERLINIVSWSAALDGRPDDVAVYIEALELLWRYDVADAQACRATMAQLEEMHEMTVADELTGPSAYGLESVLVLHCGLRVVLEPTLANVEDCSMAARNAAFHLEGLIPSRHFLSAEERSQDEDIEALLRGASADELRDRAREVGRSLLDLVRSQF
ncbi:hypothetical protein [Actinoplanes regularis]|uniref:hypothetical protein n=1 Tax=Actinoplanes regularis TaxID=52697 RepID=UPI0024A4832A|nr:hypothetical protein [Actinoplanes regularis]GLW35156.1 hypothetical protein Areg01_80920 [Actinoplanes regularis]